MVFVLDNNTFYCFVDLIIIIFREYGVYNVLFKVKFLALKSSNN